MNRRTIELVAFFLGIGAPTAAYAIRMTWRPATGTIQVAFVLLIGGAMLAYTVIKAKLSATRTGLVAAGGFLLGGIVTYVWWFTTFGDQTWRISIYVGALETALLAAVALISYTTCFVILRKMRTAQFDVSAAVTGGHRDLGRKPGGDE